MDSGEQIKIKCPECGAVLTVVYQAGCENKTVLCPVCKQKHLFKDFRLLQSEETEYGVVNRQPGKLIDITYGKTYQLIEGVNIIGRKPKNGPSAANIQIETDDKYMSRVHIEIKFDNGFHFFKVLSDKNETMVNGQLITKADALILQGGETIRLANTTLRFELPKDEDETLL